MPAMPVSKKKAQVTMSEPVVNCAQPHIKTAKRAKKSKMSTNIESTCPSFSRSLLLDDVDLPNETPTSVDTPMSTDESGLNNSEGGEANFVRRRPAFEETMGHLFGPYAKPKYKPRRRWELDTYYALFGPDGQIMMSEHPRHYDIFELHRDMRIRRQKQDVEDTQSELFGDTMSSRPASSISANVTHDRLFGENLESSDNESIKQMPRTVEVS